MKDFDTSHDQRIEKSEFIAGVAKWLNEARGSKAPSIEAGPDTMKYLADMHEVCWVLMNFSDYRREDSDNM